MENKDNLLAKWAEGLLSDNERKQFEAEHDLADLKSGLELLDQMEFPAYDRAAAWEQLKQKQQQPKNVISLSFLLKAAAVLLLIGASVFYFSGSSDRMISTDFAETKEILLPDDSKVVVNHNSVLSYDDKNWDNKRLVNLKGEAFFKVAKGSIFVVKTPNGLVQVVGTQFNVYQRDDVLRVACYEGKVKVFDEKSGFERLLLPSESAYLVGHKQSSSMFEEIGSTPSWISGKMVVQSKSVSEILNYLSKELGIKINFSNIKSIEKYSGPIYLDNIDKTMAILSMALKWDVIKKGDTIFITKSKK